MRVLLYDHSGCLNHGCEAIVRTTVNIVEKAFPGSEFGLCSYSPNEDIVLSDIPRLTVKGVEAQPLSLLEKCINIFNVKVRGNYSYYYKAAYSDVADFAKNYDLCLIIGGDTFCYGNNELCRSLTTRFKAMGKKVVLWGCSIGEEDLMPEKLETLRSLDGIFARESLTKAVLENAGIENVQVFCDPAFTLEKTAVDPLVNSDRKMLGINLSPLVAKRSKNLGRAAAELLYYIENKTDYVPLLVPHVIVPGNNDYEFLAAVKKAAKSEKSILLPGNIGAKEYKGYISQTCMFMGARTHSIIGSYSSGVPAFAFGYSIKARGIAKDLFGEELCVRGVDKITCGADMIACFEELCENKDKMKKILDEKIPSAVASAYAAGEALKNIV